MNSLKKSIEQAQRQIDDGAKQLKRISAQFEQRLDTCIVTYRTVLKYCMQHRGDRVWLIDADGSHVVLQVGATGRVMVSPTSHKINSAGCYRVSLSEYEEIANKHWVDARRCDDLFDNDQKQGGAEWTSKK